VQRLPPERRSAILHTVGPEVLEGSERALGVTWVPAYYMQRISDAALDELGRDRFRRTPSPKRSPGSSSASFRSPARPGRCGSRGSTGRAATPRSSWPGTD